MMLASHLAIYDDYYALCERFDDDIEKVAEAIIEAGCKRSKTRILKSLEYGTPFAFESFIKKALKKPHAPSLFGTIEEKE